MDVWEALITVLFDTQDAETNRRNKKYALRVLLVLVAALILFIIFG